MFIHFLIFFYCFASNIGLDQGQLINLTSRHRTKRVATVDTSVFHSDANKFIIDDKQVYIVNKFILPTVVDFPCDTKYLPVSVELTNINKETKHYDVFLESNWDVIRSEQQKSDFCRKIKTFELDAKYQVVVVNKHLELVETSKVFQSIITNLLKNYDVWTLLLYVSNVYDQDNDRIQYLMTFKVKP
jgi:hypothetical protein